MRSRAGSRRYQLPVTPFSQPLHDATLHRRFMASFLFNAISGSLPVAFPCDNNDHRVMYDIDFTISVPAWPRYLPTN